MLISVGKRGFARWTNEGKHNGRIPASAAQSHLSAEGQIVEIDGELVTLDCGKGRLVVVHRSTLVEH